MKRYLLLGLAVGLALVTGWLLFAKAQYEARLRADIENILANLPEPIQAEAGKIDVSFLGKSATITGLKGTYTDESGAHPFTIDRLAATGINLDAFKEGAGSVQFVSTLEVDKPSFSSSQFSCSAEKYYFENISGDFDSLRKEIRKTLTALVACYEKSGAVSKEARQRVLFSSLGDIWKALETVSVGKVAVKGHSYTIALDDTEITVTKQSVEQKDFSLRKMGPYSANTIKAYVDGEELLTWESLTMDSATIPSLEGFFKVLGASAPSHEELRQTLQGQEFGIRNVRSKNLVMHDFQEEGGSVFRLADFFFSYEAGAGHTVDVSFSGMSVAQKLLADMMLLSKNARLLLPDPLNFEGAFQGNATLKDGGAYDLVTKLIRFKAAALCEFTLSFDIRDLNLMGMAFGMPGEATLKTFKASMADTGISDIFFTVVAAEKEDSTEAAEREQVVARIVATRDTLPNDTLKGLVGTLGEFAAKSGSMLSISLSPETPLKINQLKGVAFTSPEALGLSVSLTPAQ